jgi:hypothetical protein
MAKEYSKETSEYRAKTYLIEQVLKDSSAVKLFEVDALASAMSGELTTLVYRSFTDNKDGLILGFYGDYWSEQSGVAYQGYNFRHYEKSDALVFLNRLKSVALSNKDFLYKELNENNLFFEHDDMKIVVYAMCTDCFRYRIYWDGFDALWDYDALNKTIKRLNKALKD